MNQKNKIFLEELLQGCYQDMPLIHHHRACQEADEELDKQLQQLLDKLPSEALKDEMMELDTAYNAFSSEMKSTAFIAGMQFGAKLMLSLLDGDDERGNPLFS